MFDNYFEPALFTFVLSIFITLLCVTLFPRLGMLDRPQRYNLKRSPIPYYGGIAIFISFFIGVFFFVPLNGDVIALLAGALVITLLGFLDDMFSLNPFLRLFVQFLACAILVWAGIGILSIHLPFLGSIDFTFLKINGFPFLVAFFTVFWVMATLNTMNFLDGVSGLNSGVTFIAAMTLFLLSVRPGIHENPENQVIVATLALILSAVSLGFLVFDFPKPKILMGDTGSTLLGFVLATLAIFSGGKVATAFLVLGIPILDMVWVVARRIYEKKKFWHGDMKHLHHRLLALGFSERQVLILYYALTAIFGGMAIAFADTQQKLYMLVALVILMLCLALSLVLIPRRK